MKVTTSNYEGLGNNDATLMENPLNMPAIKARRRPRLHRVWACVFFLVCVTLTAGELAATHFRHGHLNWKHRPDVSPSTVEFNLVSAFRRSGYPGSGLDGFPVTGDTIVEHIGSTTLHFGDGAHTGLLSFEVISFNPVENWILGRALDPSSSQGAILHTYPSANENGAPWRAAIDTCCRISTLANNPDGRYRVETTVDLSVATASPTSSLTPVINCPSGEICDFRVPGAISQPGSTLRWRLSTPQEDGGLFHPPGLSVHEPAGIIVWDTAGMALNSLWATQVVMETWSATGEDVLATAAIDFLIRVVEAGDPPVIQPPADPNLPPMCEVAIPVTVGKTVEFDVNASDPDPGDLVILNTAGLPAGATTVPELPALGNPISTTFTWTPTESDVGQHVIHFSATDPGGLQAFCPITIDVVSAAAKPSNVLFFPGIMGSQLYQPGVFSENKLWLPNRRSDVCSLKPNISGSAGSVYPKDADIILWSPPFFDDVYAEFVLFMEFLKDSPGSFDRWKIISYDWRLDVDQIARIGTGLPFRIEDLVSQVEELTDSNTRKVTLIGHSNGGLLIKALVDFLIEQGKGHMIDRVIFVATPHLGTSETIATMLHGDSDFSKFLIPPRILREATETMVGVYNLLPSQKSFPISKVATIEFGSAWGEFVSPDLRYFREVYGPRIESYEGLGLRSFLLGEFGLRSEPHTGDCASSPPNTRAPNVLRQELLNRVEAYHNRFDDWEPAGIQVFNIVGAGLPTLQSLRYLTEPDCETWIGTGVFGKCLPALGRVPVQTVHGDGTVLLSSAIHSAGKTYYLDLPECNSSFSCASRTDRKHSNIIGAIPVRTLIGRILMHDPAPEANLDHVMAEPATGNEWIRIVLGSPVLLDVFDSEGNHVGLVPNPDPESEFLLINEEIPNSAFRFFGDHAYVTLDTRDEYEIQLTGWKLGVFQLSLEEFSDDEEIAKVRFINVPVSENSRAMLRLNRVSHDLLLELDLDGDGVVDFSLAPSEGADSASSLKILAELIVTLDIPQGIKVSLRSQANQAAEAVERNNPQAAERILQAFLNHLDALSGKAISPEVALGLAGIVRRIAHGF